jgi:hypothetical protein
MPDNDLPDDKPADADTEGPEPRTPQFLAPTPSTDAPEAEDGTDESGLDPKAKAALDKVRREAANLRKRVRDLEPAAARLKNLEDKDKTELDRLNDQLAEMQAQLVEHQVREVRTAAAAAAGLPAPMAMFITASDPEEATAQAKALLEFRGGSGGAPDLRQGARKASTPKLTGDELLRRMAGRQ